MRNLLLSIHFLITMWNIDAKCISNAHGKTEGRVVEGEKVNDLEARHIASIRNKYFVYPKYRTAHVCGGSLIASKVVVTAAHCFLTADKTQFINFNNFYVVLGTFDAYGPDNFSAYNIVDRAFKDLVEFNLTTYEKDIALVFLDIAVKANHPVIRPIRLRRDKVKAGTMCQITGWGSLCENGPLITRYLQKANVPIIDLTECTKKMVLGVKVYEGEICAGYAKHDMPDVSAGDSGGPLVCEELLTGIVSFTSVSLLTQKSPTVFVEVAFYVDWIENELEKRGLQLYSAGKSIFSYYSFTLLSILVTHLIFFNL